MSSVPMPSDGEDWVEAGGRSEKEEHEEHNGTGGRRRINDASAEDLEYSLLMDYPEEVDYYALLGLARNPPPTDAEIRSAYRTLTLSFHPDKQPVELREAARRHFGRIRDAYETLVDPKKRTVYDLLGAEGVQREWGAGGAMGRGGEVESQELGTRAQTPEEFRQWFLGAMKKRERKMVNSLVQSRGSVSLGVDASDMISVDHEEGEVYFSIPSPKLSTFDVGYSFKAPLPSPEIFFGEEENEDEDAEGKDSSTEQNKVYGATRGPEITINAGISGQLKRFGRKVQVEFTDGRIESRQIPLPLLIAGRDLRLGASVGRAFGDVASAKGIMSKRPFSLLSNSAIVVEATLLPNPSLQTTFSKAIAPTPGTKPFRVNLSTTFTNSLLKIPPLIALQVTKEIGERKHAFVSWSSGTLTWPHALEVLLSPIVDLGLDEETGLAISAFNQMSQFQFGFLSVPKRSIRNATMGDDDDEEEEEEEEEEAEYRQIRKREREENNSAESWQVGISASPAGGGLSLTYARNIFTGKAANDPARSEWSSEGHYPLPPASEPRSVRVEIQSTVSLDLSLAYNIEGTRQVGNFTRMGFGVGVQGDRGLVMMVSWSRLGQKISLPVAVCPFEAVNADAAALAVIFPWAAYCALEFGFIRPRERKHRRRVIARRQKELKKLIPKKRDESLQAIELMTEQVQRRQAREEKQGGLVITKAEYGYYPPPNKKGNGNAKGYEVADVTIPVAALVDRGQLVIMKDTVKFQLLGFYDPAPLLQKKLKVWYKYQGKDHYVEANDSEGIACPMRTHLSG